MDYRIQFSRAMFGDVIPLTRVAEGMAQRRASGYGKLPPHRPSFEAAKREFEKLLINAVTNGDLVACNQFGATGTIDQIVGADAHAAMNPGMSSISFLYAKSKHLCDWAAAIGDDFEFQDTGADSVTTDLKDTAGQIVEAGFFRGLLEKQNCPTVASESQSKSMLSDNQTDEVNFDLLATREQLIAAFGKFTKMEMSWFESLKDKPNLLSARKVVGKGGRHSTEPLFCPYEVMLWLIDKNRRTGTPIRDETAWRMLQSHFPKVHAIYSIGDPNDP